MNMFEKLQQRHTGVVYDDRMLAQLTDGLNRVLDADDDQPMNRAVVADALYLVVQVRELRTDALIEEVASLRQQMRGLLAANQPAEYVTIPAGTTLD